ncbi:MAG: glycosyltransferase family 2 protein [Deltaproteobacteria bacterium]|nr:glycosyltransferase family 2 protein [Deltaproteobacteria bacterium]
MAQPLVSLGLPVYNGAASLVWAVESLLAQDFGDFELIISDNASRDGTWSLVRELAARDRRIKAVTSPVNLGARHNFLKVLFLAQGRYFKWAARDDALEPTYLASCLRVLADDPKVAICYTAARLVQNQTEEVRVHREGYQLDQGDPWERFRAQMVQMRLCNAFYGLMPLEAVCRTGLLRDTREVFAWDNLFLAEMALQGKVLELPDPLIRRGVRSGDLRIADHLARMETIDSPQEKVSGLTCPHLRMLMAYAGLVKAAMLPPGRKTELLAWVLSTGLARWGGRLDFELRRFLELVERGVYRVGWGESREGAEPTEASRPLDLYYVPELLRDLEDWLFLLPKNPLLYQARYRLLHEMGRPEEAQAVRRAVESGDIRRRGLPRPALAPAVCAKLPTLFPPGYAD